MSRWRATPWPRLRSVNSPASEYLEPVAARFSRPVHPRRSPPLVREPGGALSVPPHDWHRPPNLGRCTWGAAMGEDLNVHTWELLSAYIDGDLDDAAVALVYRAVQHRSEAHTSELQSQMCITNTVSF